MQVFDVSADIAYLALTEAYGIYRSQATADSDAAAAQAEADHLAATRPLEPTQQIRVEYHVAPCFHPDAAIVLDGLHRVYSTD